MPTINVFDLSPSVVDNAEKVVLNGAVAELNADGDPYGSAIAQWLEIVGTDVWASHAPGNTEDLAESGGVQTIINETANLWARGARRNNVSFGDCDIVFKISDTRYANKPYGTDHFATLWRQTNDCVQIFYTARAAAPGTLYVRKVINNVGTILATVGIGNVPDLYLRIKRRLTVPANNSFTFYTSPDGAVWTQRWTGQITAATFDNSHLLYPLWFTQSGASADVDCAPDIDSYYQETVDIAAQRFWPDSPTIYVIDNALVEWAFNAGAGKVWALTGAACTKTEPGASTVKFKVGYSDTGLHAGATWDGAWRTIAQVNANAAAGLYDGHRYLHVQAQFNSDATDQPTLTDFTITGSAVSVGGHNLDEVDNDLDETTHNLDEVTNDLNEATNILDVLA